jgi:hypothetical protein
MSIDKYKQYLANGADGMDDFPRYKKGMSSVPIDPEENKKEQDVIKRIMDEIELIGDDAESSEANFSGIVFVIFKFPKDCMDILEEQNTGIIKLLTRIFCCCLNSKKTNQA